MYLLNLIRDFIEPRKFEQKDRQVLFKIFKLQLERTECDYKLRYDEKFR